MNRKFSCCQAFGAKKPCWGNSWDIYLTKEGREGSAANVCYI